MENQQEIILAKLAALDTEAAKSSLLQYAQKLEREIPKSKNADEAYEKLKLLEVISHRTLDTTYNILKNIIRAKKPFKQEPMSRIGGFAINGKSNEEVVEKTIEILSIIRYSKPKEILNLLAELSTVENKNIKARAMEVISHLVQYDFQVLKQVGIGVQAVVMQELKAWNATKLKKYSGVVIKVSEQLLQPSFEGRSMTDYKTMTFSSGSLKGTAGLKKIRNDALGLLKKIYFISNAVEQKLSIINAFNESMSFVTSGTDKQLELIVIENAKAVTVFYISIIASAPYEIVAAIEEQISWATLRIGEGKVPKLKNLRAAILKKHGYSTFKVLFGYIGRLREDNDFEKERQMREEKVKEFVENVSEKTFSQWHKIIFSMADAYSAIDQGKFQYFRQFLYELAKRKPKFALRLINQKKLNPFLLDLIAGLWESVENNEARKIVQKWIKDGENLIVAAAIFGYIQKNDLPVLEQILKAAVKAKDTKALNSIIFSLARNQSFDSETIKLFILVIKELTRLHNTAWVNNVWYKGPNSIINLLDKNEIDVVLKNLLQLPNLGFEVEEILSPIAEKYPKKILDFLHQRIVEKANKYSKITDHYESVPFKFYKLHGALRKNEAIVIPVILKWHNEGGKKNNWRFRWDASHLLEEMYPAPTPLFEKTLTQLIRRGSLRQTKNIISILSKYEGQDFLWPIYEGIVQKYFGSPQYKKIKPSLLGYLSQTGVVSGPIANAYRNKKAALNGWKGRARKKAVREFITEYDKYLDELISSSEKRHEEDTEVLKRRYGDISN